MRFFWSPRTCLCFKRVTCLHNKLCFCVHNAFFALVNNAKKANFWRVSCGSWQVLRQTKRLLFSYYFIKLKSNSCRKSGSLCSVCHTTCSFKPLSTQQRSLFLYVTLLFRKKTDNIKYLNSSLLFTLGVPPRCCAIVLVTLFVKKQKQKARQALVAKSNSITGAFLKKKKPQRSSTTPTRGRHAN